MNNRLGLSAVAPLVAVVGLVAVGVGGYNFVRNGCPLSCGDCKTSDAKVVAAAATTEESCPLCPSAKTAATTTQEDACCSNKTEVVQTVAQTTEAPGGCCKADKTEAKECKQLSDGCTGDGKDGCCGGCAAEKDEKAAPVASSQPR